MRIKKYEPIEIVLIGLPILLEVVAVTLFFAAGFVWLVIGSTGQ